MSGTIRVPPTVNEPVFSYAPGSPERAELKAALRSIAGQDLDIPVIIGGEEIRTGRTHPLLAPHDHGLRLGVWHGAGAGEARRAIANTLEACREWASWPWEDRAAVFLKAAELLSTSWRATLNAATMIGQSKTAFQAEIDAACETIDFFRFGVHFAEQIFDQQPVSEKGVWNRMEFRPLEGFVYAVTPFNFTAIGANLAGTPAMVGCGVLWKPSKHAVLSAYYNYKLLEEAGLPPGVINFVPGDPVEVTAAALEHPDFAGLHFTGSTGVFQSLWTTVGRNIARYRSYPRLVGRDGGQGLHRGAPQRRPRGTPHRHREGILRVPGTEVLGGVALVHSRVGVGRDRRRPCGRSQRAGYGRSAGFSQLRGRGDRPGRLRHDHRLHGPGRRQPRRRGHRRGRVFGHERFLHPSHPGPGRQSRPRDDVRRDLRAGHVGPRVPGRQVVRNAGHGRFHFAVCADRRCLLAGPDGGARRAGAAAQRGGQLLHQRQAHGAVVGQQPFGGARASGTNDKAGSAYNIMRWLSPRTIKENLAPPTSVEYPYMGAE